MVIVGISQWHNSSLCIIENGEVKLHIENERLSRTKYDNKCYQALSLLPAKIDILCVSGLTSNTNYLLKFANEDYDKFLKDLGYKHAYINQFRTHHKFHASCAFYNSGFEEAICIIKDGMGSEFEINDKNFLPGTYGRESGATFVARYPHTFETIDKHVTVNFNCDYTIDDIIKINNSGSEALLFQKTAKYYGFNELDAGKVMGMSAYGKSKGTQIYKGDYINSDLLKFRGNNLTQGYVNKEFDNFQDKCDFAYDIQTQIQSKIKNYILKMVEKTGIKNVCLSGGYFLNCVANYYFLKTLPKDINVYVEPISSDAGTSMGIAKYYWHQLTKDKTIRKQKSLYYGNQSMMNEDNIKELFKDYKVTKTNKKEVAKLLSENNIVALFQGKCESGPRALGNRSLLFNPMNKDGQDIVNTIKKREKFRPFAATVLEEHAEYWFDLKHMQNSKFMMYAVDCKRPERIPAVCHVDNTCRIQTLSKEDNKNFYELIEEFQKLHQVPMLLNTSLNLAGDPIVNSYEDLLDMMNKSSLKYSYLADFDLLINT